MSRSDLMPTAGFLILEANRHRAPFTSRQSAPAIRIPRAAGILYIADAPLTKRGSLHDHANHTIHIPTSHGTAHLIITQPHGPNVVVGHVTRGQNYLFMERQTDVKTASDVFRPDNATKLLYAGEGSQFEMKAGDMLLCATSKIQACRVKGSDIDLVIVATPDFGYDAERIELILTNGASTAELFNEIYKFVDLIRYSSTSGHYVDPAAYATLQLTSAVHNTLAAMEVAPATETDIDDDRETAQLKRLRHCTDAAVKTIKRFNQLIDALPKGDGSHN